MNATAARGLVVAGAAAVISGVSVFLNSYGVKAFGDATTYTTLKNMVAGLVLITVVAAAKIAAGRASSPRPAIAVALPATRRQLGLLAAVAVIGGSVPFVLFFEGLSRATSGPVQAQFINKTLVIWVALLAVSTLGERVGRLQLVAILLLALGQATLSGGIRSIAHMRFGAGEAMILAATLLWAIEVVLAKRLLRGLSSWTVALARMVFGSVLLFGWLLTSGRAQQLPRLTLHQWLWVALTGLLLAGYVATWLAALALAPAVSVTSVLVAAVPVTALLQAVVSHVALRPQLPGLSLVVLGCVAVAVAARFAGGRSRAAATG